MYLSQRTTLDTGPHLLPCLKQSLHFWLLMHWVYQASWSVSLPGLFFSISQLSTDTAGGIADVSCHTPVLGYGFCTWSFSSTLPTEPSFQIAFFPQHRNDEKWTGVASRHFRICLQEERLPGQLCSKNWLCGKDAFISSFSPRGSLEEAAGSSG